MKNIVASTRNLNVEQVNLARAKGLDEVGEEALQEWGTAMDEANHRRIESGKVATREFDQVNRGVSLEFILRLAEHVKSTEPRLYKKLKTKDLVHGYQAELNSDGKFINGADPPPYSIRALTQPCLSNMVDFFTDHADHPASLELKQRLQQYDIPELRKYTQTQQALATLRSDHVQIHASIADEDEDVNVDEVREEFGEGANDRDVEDIPWFGRADYFVSHAWISNFSELVEALKNPRSTGSESFAQHIRKYFWIDAFAVNQHYDIPDVRENARIAKKRKEDLNNFEYVIENVNEGVAIFMSPWFEPTILNRSWCWYEIAVALKNSKKLNMALTNKAASALREAATAFTEDERLRTKQQERHVTSCSTMLSNIDVESSSCTLDVDHEYIMRQIEEKSGGASLVTKHVKLNIAGLFMTTADSLLETQDAKGIDRLYKALIQQFDSAPQEQAAMMNKLVRTLMVTGRLDQAEMFCKEAIDIQNRLIQKERNPNNLKSIKLDLAVNLNSLGRLYGETPKLDNLEQALSALHQAEEIRREYRSPDLHEVLYNIGRVLVLHYEQCYVPSLDSIAKRAQDLQKAKSLLEESRELQDELQHELQKVSKNKVMPSLGACYVFLGKVTDLLGSIEDSYTNVADCAAEYDASKDEAYEYFQLGELQQQKGFGPHDPRIYLTQLDTARHFVRPHTWVPKAAWRLLVNAHNNLQIQAHMKGVNAIKILECEVEMMKLLQDLNTYREEDVIEEEEFPGSSNLIDVSLKSINWIYMYRPHLYDSREAQDLIESIFGFGIERAGSKQLLALGILERMPGATIEFSSEFCQKEREYMSQLRTPSKSPFAIPAQLEMGMETMLSGLPPGIADIIVADPPYNISIDSTWDEVGHRKFIRNIESWASHLVRALSPEGIGFAFSDMSYASYWIHALRTARGDSSPEVIVESAIWYKPDAAWRKQFIDSNPQLKSSSAFDAPQIVRESTEVAIIFRRSSSAAGKFTDVLRKKLNNDAANVWKIGKCVEPERLQNEYWHAAQKPLSLMRILVDIGVEFAKDRQAKSADPTISLQDVKKRDILVLEPFLGTGSGSIASMELGLPAIGCDLDYKDVEATRFRIESMISKPAPKSSSFNSLRKSISGFTRTKKR